MQYSSNLELRQLEQGLEQAVYRQHTRMEMWAGHVEKHVKEYGLPIMYVGHVDLAFRKSFTPEAIIRESRKVSIKHRADFLKEKTEELLSSVPDVLFAFCRSIHCYNPDIILANERCIEVDSIVAYKVYPIRKEVASRYLYSFMDIKCRAKYSDRTSSTAVYFSNDADEKEAVSIIEYALNGKEFDYPEKVIDSSKAKKDTPDTHPNFFGNSLLRPQKELIDRLLYQGFEQDYTGFTKEIAGVKFRFNFIFGKESQLIHMIHGYSYDEIKGYENARKVFDAFLEILKADYGPWGLKLTDVPAGTRKNSIMKGLRENTIKIEATYTWRHIDIKPSFVTLEIWGDEGQDASIRYVLYDSLNEQESDLAHEKALAEAKLRREQNKGKKRKRCC